MTPARLDGLTGAARDERAELIAWLRERGFTAEQIRDSYQPMLLATRRLLGDDGTKVSAREVSEQTGLDLDLLTRVQRASGLPRAEDPDAAVQSRVDGEAAKYAKQFVDLGISADQVVLVVQVVTEGLARAAGVMRNAALAAVLEPGSTELDVAQRSEKLIEQVAPLLGPMIADMLRLQLLHVIESESVNAAERAEGLTLPGAREVTVAFADLVGFTKLGQAVPPEDLEKLAHQLTDTAREVVNPPVRYVKSIGDEVMLISSDPKAMLEGALDLLEACEATEGFPPLRVGLATGPAVNRSGDWFGSSVNLASRVTGTSRPGAILVAEATRDALGDDADSGAYTWSFAGARHLKGIGGETKLFRVRRADS